MSIKPKPSAVEELDSQRCPTCNTTSKRSLVVCIDGTSNQFSIRNTNVVELYSRLIKNEDHRTFYNSGIGTYAKPHGLTFSQWIANKRDLAFAWRFDKVLLSAYRWLSENYETGDRIFLFGFSRGAYQVRVLSAMIRDVGLIHKGNQDQIPFAYKLYADPNSREVSREPLSKYESVKSYLYHVAGKKYPLKPGSTVDLAARFKATFSRQDVKVHFVGVWDTVSSVGFVYGKTLPGTTDGMEHACFFRHALAIHERRVKFLPEFVGTPKTGSGDEAKRTAGDRSSGGAGAQPRHNPASDRLRGNAATLLLEGPSVSNNVQSESQTAQNSDNLPRDDTLRADVPKKDVDAPEPHVKAVWFAGSHSDIGGGNAPNMDLDRFGPSQRWMSFESMLAGLKLGDDPRKWEGDPKTFKPYESLTGAWWILELFPVKQLSFLDSSKRDETVRRLHLGRWRRTFAAEENQRFHETALEVIGRDCLPPKAEKHLLAKRERDPPGEAHSDHAYGPNLKLWPDFDIESDPYYNALSFLRLLHTDRLRRASDIERFEQVLAHASATPAGQKSIRDAIQELVEEDFRSHDQVLSEWGSILLHILQEWDTKASADPACTRTLGAVFGLFKHLDARLSFPQSRELRRLAKSFATRGSEGSEKFLLLVNSVKPAALNFSLRDKNNSAVFHADGKRVILGSTRADNCLVLDYSSSPLPPPLYLVTGCQVLGVAVSGDCNGAFIGVALKTVLTIWDTASPGDEPIHTVENAPAQLRCLAFNHDGTRLVAGCSNGAIIVWTKANGPEWSQLASFPDDSIWSISWSRDNYVAAGSMDGFLRVWETGTASAPTELLPRTKVGPCVDCLAFAPMTTPGSSPIPIVTGGRGFVTGLAVPRLAHWQLGVVEHGTYRLIGHLMGDGDHWPRCVTFSPDGKHIAAGMSAGMVRIWDADSCKPVCDDIYIPGKPNPLALSFEPDDTAVKAVCSNGLVRLLCWK